MDLCLHKAFCDLGRDDLAFLTLNFLTRGSLRGLDTAAFSAGVEHFASSFLTSLSVDAVADC